MVKADMQAYKQGTLATTEPCPGLVATGKTLKRKRVNEPVRILVPTRPGLNEIWVMEEEKEVQGAS